MSNTPKLSRSDRLLLLVMKNRAERKVKIDRIMSEKEKRIAELILAEEKLTEEINNFTKRTQFSKEFIEYDKKVTSSIVDFCYVYILRNLNQKDNLEELLKMFHKKLDISLESWIYEGQKPELNEYVGLITELSKVKIQIEYLKKGN